MVINGGDITGEKRFQAIYKRFLSDNNITADSNIKVLALYTGDFISIMGKLPVDKTYNFKSSLLVRLFDTLIDKLRQNDSLSESGWMVKTWVNIVSNAQTPELSLNELLEDKTPDKTRPG